jgi:hypothetical protein
MKNVVMRAFVEKVAAEMLDKPITGKWKTPGEFPLTAKVRGETFVRTMGLDKNDSVAQYRDTKARGSKHMYVLPNGRYLVDHVDEYNPHYAPFRHFIKDVIPELMGKGDGK